MSVEKLVSTWAEKLTWAHGDAELSEPTRTDIERIGALICSENTNPLAMYAMLAQEIRSISRLIRLLSCSSAQVPLITMI